MDRRDFLQVCAASIIPLRDIRMLNSTPQNQEVQSKTGTGTGVRCVLSGIANSFRFETLQILALLRVKDAPRARKELLESWHALDARPMSAFLESLRSAPGFYALIQYGELLPIISGYISAVMIIVGAQNMRRKYGQTIRKEEEESQ